MKQDDDLPDDGFDQFMAERWPRLVRSAYLLTSDRHDAEDLAQAVLTKVFSSWHRVRRAEDVDAYVHRIMINCNSNRFRRRRVAEHPVPIVPDHLRTTADHAGEWDQRSTFMTALAQLPPRQRAVIVLRYYEDMTEAQTSHVMGCSIGTVKSQTWKALARLREHSELAAYIPLTPQEGAA